MAEFAVRAESVGRAVDDYRIDGRFAAMATFFELHNARFEFRMLAVRIIEKANPIGAL